MANDNVLVKRFSELALQLVEVEVTKQYLNTEYFSGYRVNGEILLNWKVKAKSLISKACGLDSVHYSQFEKAEKPQAFRTSADELSDLKAIFLAAKEDYEGGYMKGVRVLVQAEIFESELEQSKELLFSGYHGAAAVIAGVVLETTLRQMCVDRKIQIGKLDRMNSELAKAGVYNLLVQKRLTALADIRNNAAHGNYNQFKSDDVEDMILYIEKFTADNL